MNFHDTIVYISVTQDGYFALQTLLAARKTIHYVITLSPDKSAHVADYIDFRPLCSRYKVTCLTVRSIKELEVALVNDKARLIIINGWSELLSERLLSSPTLGCVGTHPALLPKNRGRAPIAWHFLNNEQKGGVTLFYLDKGCDSGPIIDQCEFFITSEDNASTYYERITQLGSDMLLDHFDAFSQSKVPAKEQNHAQATYLLKRIPEDSLLDFSWTSKKVCAHIRAVAELYPLAFFYYQGKKICVCRGSIPTNAPHYSGVIGQIAAVNSHSIRIVTGDGVVDISCFFTETGDPIKPIDFFKVGHRTNQLEQRYG